MVDQPVQQIGTHPDLWADGNSRGPFGSRRERSFACMRQIREFLRGNRPGDRGRRGLGDGPRQRRIHWHPDRARRLQRRMTQRLDQAGHSRNRRALLQGVDLNREGIHGALSQFQRRIVDRALVIAHCLQAGFQGMTEIADGGDAREPRAALEGMQQAVDAIERTNLLGVQLPLAELGIQIVKQIPGIFQEDRRQFRIGGRHGIGCLDDGFQRRWRRPAFGGGGDFKRRKAGGFIRSVQGFLDERPRRLHGDFQISALALDRCFGGAFAGGFFRLGGFRGEFGCPFLDSNVQHLVAEHDLGLGLGSGSVISSCEETGSATGSDTGSDGMSGWGTLLSSGLSTGMPSFDPLANGSRQLIDLGGKIHQGSGAGTQDGQLIDPFTDAIDSTPDKGQQIVIQPLAQPQQRFDALFQTLGDRRNGIDASHPRATGQGMQGALGRFVHPGIPSPGPTQKGSQLGEMLVSLGLKDPQQFLIGHEQAIVIGYLVRETLHRRFVWRLGLAGLGDGVSSQRQGRSCLAIGRRAK